MVESLLCGTCAAAMKKEPFDSDVELVAQGIGNMVIPFFGGVPSTAAIARTSVAVKSGGKTRLTAVFQSLFLIACVFVLSGAIGRVPYAALAGVLAVTAFRMNDWATIRSYFGTRHVGAVLQFSVTCVATVLLDLTYAILIGVGLAFVLLLCDLCRATVDAAHDGDTVTFRLFGNCYFAFADTLRAAVEADRAGAKTCIFDFSGVSYADLTVVGTVAELCENLRAAGRDGDMHRHVCQSPPRVCARACRRHSANRQINFRGNTHEQTHRAFQNNHQASACGHPQLPPRRHPVAGTAA